mmetsp:Transcript_5710/g.6189  ORF Transcript_5710/g.6189 Transcript_5710/m.6189 type:complete len:301 (+) Transcript_5710:18-920(+)
MSGTDAIFWATNIPAGQKVNVEVPEIATLVITQASVSADAKGPTTVSLYTKADKDVFEAFVLCTLNPDQGVYQQKLDVPFESEKRMVFRATGPGNVTLMGYYHFDDDDGFELDASQVEEYEREMRAQDGYTQDSSDDDERMQDAENGNARSVLSSLLSGDFNDDDDSDEGDYVAEMPLDTPKKPPQRSKKATKEQIAEGKKRKLAAQSGLPPAKKSRVEVEASRAKHEKFLKDGSKVITEAMAGVDSVAVSKLGQLIHSKLGKSWKKFAIEHESKLKSVTKFLNDSRTPFRLENGHVSCV